MDTPIEAPPHRYRSASLLALDTDKFLRDAFPLNRVVDPRVRVYRFLEEAMELAQSLDIEHEQAENLLNYVFARPKGEPKQELGGCVMTLVAVSNALKQDFVSCGFDAIVDARERIPTIREKDKNKPKAWVS